MMADVNVYQVVMNLLITFTIATSFMVVGGRRLDTAIKVAVAQAVLLAGVTATLGWATGNKEIYIAALLTVVVKAVIIPYILRKVVGRVVACREVKSYINVKMSFVICAGLIIIAYSVTGRIMGPNAGIISEALPAAISLILIGLFVMITRKLAVMQIMGLIIMENGIFLAGVGTTHGMPLVVELGIFLDVLIGVLIMGILAFRINRSFDTIDTENLKNLRG
ncbi:NADH-quinone oxidoreductase subunit K [Phosphitispora fastidiosa]|uniref:NADH-quinone oxidoreductase subunit K n=1 Tax=Phosphitispora fastidiosa TaxID=2837202 RepID=UPI001E49A608|nr:NADH-quinone oxidoreductase subunit K [Phosphitispora fastidiosa]MBU7006518.1 hydrogenase-4 membrane subunit HyfE [Phosphitispora fastidiosa]